MHHFGRSVPWWLEQRDGFVPCSSGETMEVSSISSPLREPGAGEVLETPVRPQAGGKCGLSSGHLTAYVCAYTGECCSHTCACCSDG